jgi:hypothetical protein
MTPDQAEKIKDLAEEYAWAYWNHSWDADSAELSSEREALHDAIDAATLIPGPLSPEQWDEMDNIASSLDIG